MKHIKIYEEYSLDDLDDLEELRSALRNLGVAMTQEEEDMLKFINQFGGGMSPEDYAEYLYDYFKNPEEYGIDKEGDYYDMIWYLYENSVEDHARSGSGSPMRMGAYKTWNEEGIANEPLYKLYLKMSDYYSKVK